MKEILVSKNEAGQRLDKLLTRILGAAPPGFLYKMLRKKNIVLNGKKATGKEQVLAGDRVTFYLADETYEKFSQPAKALPESFGKPFPAERIVYEDRHILIADKPAGELSQKKDAGDCSVNEQILAYLLEKGEITRESLRTFRPSVCNRLDRNTSGLLIFGKTLAGLQAMSGLLRDRSLHKYYLCLAKGRTDSKFLLEHVLQKDRDANTVSVGRAGQAGFEDASPIRTECRLLWTDGEVSLLEVLLITGRSHQIRAHLAYAGHPIIGDRKYGDPALNAVWRQRCGVSGQLLHAHCIVFPPMEGEFAYLSGREFTSPLPPVFAETARVLGIPRDVAKTT